jgi:4-amino-4-deoxychorismate lyase
VESSFSDPIPPGTRLIETFGWTPGRGVARLKAHLARLSSSAMAFGYPVDHAHIAALIASLSGDKPLRCRLTLGRDGVADLTWSHLPAPLQRPWRVGFAGPRLDASDIWLRHKTTQRALYDRARDHLPVGIDELLFLNDRGEVCEGTITSLFVTCADGGRVTPPLSSGCLPGILRAELLARGAVRESVVTPELLDSAAALHLGNALRGEISAVMAHPTGGYSAI